MNWIDLTFTDDVAVLWLNQQGASVNTIATPMLEECAEVLQEITTNEAVKGVVIISAKPDFGVGADLEAIYGATEHGEAEAISRRGHELLQIIALSPKPVVAAIRGLALGGGLEIAIACHYRLATANKETFFAFPEVKLGLLPAGGATQRLPKLIGIRTALDLMLSGKQINAYQARSIGLIDRLVHHNQLLPYAIQQVQLMANNKEYKHKTPSSLDKLFKKNRVIRNLLFDRLRDKLLQNNFGNYPAPFKILECVEIGCRYGEDMGKAAEINKFDELAVHPVTKQLIYLFFKANEKKKPPHRAIAQTVNSMAIIGAGLMGTGIAEISMLNGTEVVLSDVQAARSAHALQNIWRHLTNKVRKKNLIMFERWQYMNLLRTQTGFENLQRVNIIIEAVPENLALKQQVLIKCEANTSENCIFASTTSAIPIGQIALHSKRPEQVIGMHYFPPVAKISLLEIIITSQTSEQTLATALEFGIRQGKTCIVVKDSPGFYLTRIMVPYLNEALLMLEEGGDMWQIETCARQLGFPVGPFTLIDQIGINSLAHILEGPLYAYFGETRGAGAFTASRLLRILHDKGLEGRRNGRGFYRYDSRTGKKKEIAPDKNVYALIDQSPNQRNWFKDKQVRQRLLMMMTNESVRCLEDGILSSVHDGNLGAVLGLGYPAYSGGPFSYLDAISCTKAIIRLENLARRYGNRFLPAPTFYDFAKKGTKFVENG